MGNDLIENKSLRVLLLVHGLITFAASIVLIIVPAAIPKTVNIHISPNEYLLCYFLGAAELCIAFLSVFARKIKDKTSLRLISATFIVFHMATGALEIFVCVNSLSLAIIFNIFLRLFISILFWYFGIYRIK
jgi:hypothetical protein